MTMKAIVFNEVLKLSLDEPRPIPPRGEALVRVLLAGICNTDIEITRGYMGYRGILGHEFTGIVEEINDNDQSLLGKRVVGEINCACHREDCEYCNRNLGRHCPNRTVLGIVNRNGCMAEYLTLPVENLLEVPVSVSSEIATLTEPLAAGFEILEQIRFFPGQEVLIVGDGKLGLLINHALSTTEARITHVGKHAGKLKIAESNGCETFLLDRMPQKLYDIVVEATGNMTGFQFSISHSRPRGTVVLKSTIAADQNIDLAPVVVNEISIIGSRCGLFRPAIDYLKTGADLSPIIQAVYPIDQGLEAFEAARTRGTMKVMIRFS
jgi:threonine dehydrogenase-like Zn-dependent dehydrogenase